MTPERWRQVGELFKASVPIDPAGREPWLRAACDGDDDLRAEVGRLLALDERADRVGFMMLPEATVSQGVGSLGHIPTTLTHSPLIDCASNPSQGCKYG